MIHRPKTKGEIASVYFNSSDRTPLAVVETYECDHIYYLDATFKKHFDLLYQLNQRGYPILVGTSSGKCRILSLYFAISALKSPMFFLPDFTKWLLVWSSDSAPTKWYAYDVASMKATFLFVAKDAQLDYEYSPLHPVEIRSRDGLTQMCYLSLPLEVSGK